ncbi:MAG: ABC transporter ATP-binding protein [Infirmifilum uzonense]|uniref:ABC transporter ATP-binding protein n=1 Tax=Infirmifilum uzonense TaxID=1550241 RepID=UPI003C739D41
MAWWHDLGRLDEQEAKIPLREVASRVLPLLRPYTKYFVIIVLAAVVRLGANLLFPLLTGRIIDSALSKNFNGILVFSAAYLAAALVFWASGVARVYATAIAGQKFVRDLRERLMRSILGSKVVKLRGELTGKIVSRVMNDVDVISDLFTQGLVEFIVDLLTMIGAFFIMFTLSTELSLVILPLVVSVFLVSFYFARRARAAFTRARRMIAEVSARVEQDASGAAVVKTFIHRRGSRESEFEQVSRAYMESNVEATRVVSAVNPTLSAIRVAGVALILYYGGMLIASGRLTPGILVAFFGYLNMFFMPLQLLAMFINSFQSVLVSTERVTSLLNMEQEVSGSLVKPVEGHVEVKEVTFSYEEGLPVLKGVSIEAHPGEMVAVVGPTGSGKTTLAKLLLRFYEPESGSILLDGTPVEEYDLKYLRSVVAYVPQEPSAISGKVIDNITASRKAPRAEVEELIGRLGVKSIIESIPGGLDGEIVEEGKNLSKGQRQLLSLLRAIVSKPRVLVLDEATSNLDVVTELNILQELQRMIREEKATLIVIAHRLAAIRNADRIYVLRDGKVVEQGRHEELLRLRGTYYRLWIAQVSDLAETLVKVVQTATKTRK